MRSEARSDEHLTIREDRRRPHGNGAAAPGGTPSTSDAPSSNSGTNSRKPAPEPVLADLGLRQTLNYCYWYLVNDADREHRQKIEFWIDSGRWPTDPDSLDVDAHAEALAELEQITATQRAKLERGEAIEPAVQGQSAMLKVLTDDSDLGVDGFVPTPADPARAIAMAKLLPKPAN